MQARRDERGEGEGITHWRWCGCDSVHLSGTRTLSLTRPAWCDTPISCDNYDLSCCFEAQHIHELPHLKDDLPRADEQRHEQGGRREDQKKQEHALTIAAEAEHGAHRAVGLAHVDEQRGEEDQDEAELHCAAEQVVAGPPEWAQRDLGGEEEPLG